MPTRHLLMKVTSCPAGVLDALAGEVRHRPAQLLGTAATKFHPHLLATTTRNWHGTSNCLQRLCCGETLAVIPNRSQQTRRGQRAAGTGQAAPPVCFRVCVEDLDDALA